MKQKLVIAISILAVCFGCGKSSTDTNSAITWNGKIIVAAPVNVPKTSSKKVFAHYMPWFTTPFYNGGEWGQHWKMANKNPNIITNGQREIASHYYPLNTGPYAVSDTVLLDYQLLLMKLSGIDGIFIDWPGTLDFSDYRKNLDNSNALVARLSKVGLKYAILYEDQNLEDVSPNNRLAQAQADMSYIQTNYFKDAGTTYEVYNGKPMLLDFGPFGPLQNASDWNNILSVMTTLPAFFTYEYGTAKGGTNAAGDFAWVQSSHLTNLNNYYAYNSGGKAKISGVYPGFNTFYAEGGWPNVNTNWKIDYGSGSNSTFAQTLSLALQQPGNYVQLVTWNDYGEGTMIEPTVQYGYSFLTELQKQLGVSSSLSQSDLEAVAKLYRMRSNYLSNYNQAKLNELDQVFYYMTSLKMDSAKGLLANF